MPIKGYDHLYEISNYGTVRSLDRTVFVRDHPTQPNKRIKGKVKKWGMDGGGYPKVELSKDGIVKSYNIHVLVATHFVKGQRDNFVVRHLDGNRMNAWSGNLKWGTHSENAQDTIAHGNNKALNRVTCPYHHLLKEPNLRVDGTKYRRCLACKKAQDALKSNDELEVFGLQYISDIYYGLIMSDNLPRYFKIGEFVKKGK